MNGDIIIILVLILLMPIFVIIFTYFTSIEFRCKLKRQLLKKNFGIVNLVSKDYKSILSLIKNFDHDIIEIGGKIWIIEPDRIYRKNKETIIPIQEKDIKFIAGIPTLYLNADSLYPLTFFKEETKINPAELFAPVNAYIITKEAELLRWKRTYTIGVIILLCLLAISVYYSFSTHDMLQNKILPLLNSTLQR